jgi:hypothetical protein
MKEGRGGVPSVLAAFLGVHNEEHDACEFLGDWAMKLGGMDGGLGLAISSTFEWVTEEVTGPPASPALRQAGSFCLPVNLLGDGDAHGDLPLISAIEAMVTEREFVAGERVMREHAEITALSEVLVFHVARHQDGAHPVHRALLIPEALDMTPFVVTAGDDQLLYSLSSVIIRTGADALHGHWFTYRRSSELSWVRISDSAQPAKVVESVRFRDFEQNACVGVYTREGSPSAQAVLEPDQDRGNANELGEHPRGDGGGSGDRAAEALGNVDNSVSYGSTAMPGREAEKGFVESFMASRNWAKREFPPDPFDGCRSPWSGEVVARSALPPCGGPWWRSVRMEERLPRDGLIIPPRCERRGA